MGMKIKNIEVHYLDKKGFHYATHKFQERVYVREYPSFKSIIKEYPIDVAERFNMIVTGTGVKDRWEYSHKVKA